MKAFAVLAYGAICASSVVQAAVEHPVAGAIAKLKGLKEQVQNDGFNEQVTYEKYTHWCSTQETALSKAIAKSNKAITENTACEEANKNQHLSLGQQKSELEGDLLDIEAKKTKAGQIHGSAEDIYKAESKQLGDAITAIGQALDLIKNAKTTVGGASLLQAKLQDLAALPAVLVQLSDAQSDMLLQPTHEEHVQEYGFKGGNVLELLKDLLAKFKAKKVEVEAAWTNTGNNNALAGQAMAGEEAAMRTTLETVTGLWNQAEADRIICNTAKIAADGTLKEDKEDLAETKSGCDLKADEWGQRSTNRKNEIAAIDKAIELMTTLSGIRTAAPSNPALTPVAFLSKAAAAAKPALSALEEEPSLYQLQKTDPKMRAVNLLKQHASQDHSRALERLAEDIQEKIGGTNPAAAELNNMIEKMIFHLHSEQTDEDKHKLWCDKERSVTSDNEKEKTKQIGDLQKAVDAHDANIVVLKQEVSDAQTNIATSTGAQNELNAIREAGKTENAAALKEAENCEATVAKAIEFITAHYKSTGAIAKEAWEFLQKADQPTTWEGSYTAAEDPATGIISVLQSVSAMCSKTRADTRAQETADENTYRTETREITKRIAGEESTVKVKNEELSRQKAELATTSSRKKELENQRDSVNQYASDLAENCGMDAAEAHKAYTERKTARDDEIEALGKAKEILAEAFADKFLQLAGELKAQKPALFLAPVKPARF